MNYSQYDEIAENYDALFKDEKSINENCEVGELLPPLNGNVLDVGCGTGLLIEISKIEKDRYYGIDPSKKMLDALVKKHGEYKNLMCIPMCDAINCDFFGTIISIFGSPSYLSDEVLYQINRSKCKLFLMFYKEVYHPVTYFLTGKELSHFVRCKKQLRDIFKGCTIKEFNNYYIVER